MWSHSRLVDRYGRMSSNRSVFASLRRSLSFFVMVATGSRRVEGRIESVINRTFKVKRLKAMDMRYNWLNDQVKQGQLNVIWCEGHKNIVDYFTKDLPD